MPETVLVSGGAGFIGSHLVDALLAKGHKVVVLDNLYPQVHPTYPHPPAYLNREAHFIQGDVRNHEMVKKALVGVEVVFHLAAAVGVGQSMYEIDRYVSVNSLGMATILQAITQEKVPVRKVLVASSMSVYGEGKYQCPGCGVVFPGLRSVEQLKKKVWDPLCPACGKGPLKPLPTDENKPVNPASIYALNKLEQEQMCIMVGKAYRVPAVALRFFNVYGERQALSNPYTGVVAIFAARLLNDRPPLIFEDGTQQRDFIYVEDVVRACLTAMESDAADREVFNVATGKPVNVTEIAQLLAQLLGKQIEPEIVSQFRVGDVRHCFGDASKIKQTLGWESQYQLAQGLPRLLSWLQEQKVQDRVEEARHALEERGLTF